MGDDFVVTRGSMSKRNADKDFVAVSYTAPKKKHKSNELNQWLNPNPLAGLDNRNVNLPNESKEHQLQAAKLEQEKAMKRARFDVIKFGMSGFDGAKGEEAKINLAIKLGAKPPKKKAKNYKELKLEKQKAKEDARKQENISTSGKTSGKSNFDKKRRRKQPDLLSPYGVVTKKSAAITNNKRRS